jgi:hypothetical protein
MGISFYIIFYRNVYKPSGRFRLLLLFAFFLFYLFCGSYLADIINSEEDINYYMKTLEIRTKFEEAHGCISEAEMDQMIEIISKSGYMRQALVGANSSHYTLNWLWGGDSIFFTFTLLSTIGYGNVYPMTQMGKLFCVFYIIIGVPLTIILQSKLIEKIELIFEGPGAREMTKKIASTSLLTSSKTRTLDDTIEIEDYMKKKLTPKFKKRIVVQFFLIGIGCVLLVYIIPAFILINITELNWSFIDAIYFCFISITTIGFGN